MNPSSCFIHKNCEFPRIISFQVLHEYVYRRTHFQSWKRLHPICYTCSAEQTALSAIKTKTLKQNVFHMKTSPWEAKCGGRSNYRSQTKILSTLGFLSRAEAPRAQIFITFQRCFNCEDGFWTLISAARAHSLEESFPRQQIHHIHGFWNAVTNANVLREESFVETETCPKGGRTILKTREDGT